MESLRAVFLSGYSFIMRIDSRNKQKSWWIYGPVTTRHLTTSVILIQIQEEWQQHFFPMIAPCGETYFHRLAGRGSDGCLIIDVIVDISETSNLITTHLIFVLLTGALVLYLL